MKSNLLNDVPDKTVNSFKRQEETLQLLSPERTGNILIHTLTRATFEDSSKTKNEKLSEILSV